MHRCPLASTVLVTTIWARLGLPHVLDFVCLLTVCTLRRGMVGSLAFMYQELTLKVDVAGNVCMKGCCLLAARMFSALKLLRSALLGIRVGFGCTHWRLACCVACLPRVSCNKAVLRPARSVCMKICCILAARMLC